MPHANPPPSPSLVDAPAPTPVRLGVLLVEDDPATYTALRMILTRRGYDVTIVTHLDQALAALAAGPDCIILDLMLPDGSGLQLLKKVREANLSIRVLVTTGLNDPEELSAVSALKPDAILRKPIDLGELLLRLSQVR